MQQRGISELQIELIATFGEYHFQKGCDNYTYLSKKKVASLRSALDRIDKVRVIESSGNVVTAFHQIKPIRTTKLVA
jgi:hypothetical protein